MMSGVSVTSPSDNGVATHLVDAVQLAVTQLNQSQAQGTECMSSYEVRALDFKAKNNVSFLTKYSDASAGSGEPPTKRQHLDDSVPDINMDQSIKQILFNINKAICLRLDGIESKLETVGARTRFLEDKVEQVVSTLKQNGNLVVHSGANSGFKRSSAVIVGLPAERSGQDSHSSDSQSSLPALDTSFSSLGPNVQLITLNTEEDFPHGTWLGDENNPEMRVRVPITPSDLLHVHSNCRTPEKMALALLDYLFDRETQASSNLSGMGKHGKRQLDPLMIYGIRCHLIHRFGVTEQDWHRIKQNIDSKCRTAFRRKVRGLPLTVKAFRGKSPATYMHVSGHPSITELNSDDSLQEDAELHIQQGEVDLQQMQHATEILQTAQGEIQVLHATPEQVAQLQQAHQIQILQGDGTQVMQLHPGDGQESIQVAVSMAQQEGIQVVNAATGETIHIEPQTNEDGSLQINAPVEGEVLQGEDGSLHITSQGSDGTLHIQTEDGTTQEIKVQND